MLLGKQFGRRHQRGLPAGFDGGQRGQCGNDGLARADIALHEAQHRRRRAKIACDFGGDARLRARRHERQLLEKARAQFAIAAQRRRRVLAQALAQALQAQVLGQQLLERQALLRRVGAEREPGDIGIRRRPMYVNQRGTQGR